MVIIKMQYYSRRRLVEMNYSQIRMIFGENIRRGHKKEAEPLDRYFSNPIIHRQIKGDKVYVPLNLSRIWDQIG